MIIEAIRWICNIVLAVSILYGIYQGYISIHMFGDVKPPFPQEKTIHKFAILVCARNEEGVISKLLGSLEKQNYPPEAFDIFVTADNCTDNTAAVARLAGATVFERFDPLHKSKGYALNWTFAHFLNEYKGRYDACVIFDADNVVDKNFLEAMNRQLNAGQPIAAGFRMGKNPSSSWVAGCSSVFWLMQTRFCFVPRIKMNLPCFSVGGTGFMFALSVLGERGWQTHSVCEDIEFTLNSIADGRFVAFAPDAVFYDEQPLKFSQSLRQRYRWSVGSLQLLSISTPRLFQALKSGKKQVFDAFIYSFGSVLAGVSGFSWALLMLLDAVVSKNWSKLLVTGTITTVGSYIAVSLSALLVLFLEKRNWPQSWKAVLTYPIYLLSWSIINMIVLFYRNPDWKTVPHTESLSIEEVETGPATVNALPPAGKKRFKGAGTSDIRTNCRQPYSLKNGRNRET